MSSRRRRRRQRRIRRRLVLAGSFGVAVLVLVLAFTAFQAWRARTALLETQANLNAMTRAVSAADVSGADEAVRRAQASSRSADRNTSGPVWWAAEKLPWFGDDVTAVRTVAQVSHDLTAGALRDLVRAGTDFSSEVLKPDNGRIRVEKVKELTPALSRGADELDAAAVRVSKLETGGLVSSLRGPVEEVNEKLTAAATVSADAEGVAKLLPRMLGSQRQQTYLLLFQNNAEIRSLGGFGGAFAVVTANDGRLDLTRTSGPGEVGYLDPPADRMTPEEAALFGDDIVRWSQDTVMNPDFPRAAQLLAKMWQKTQGQPIDGVISFDPVALSSVLRATGPVSVQGRRLTAGNAVDTLLRDTYLEIPSNPKQNAFFKETTRQVFGRISQGRFAPTTFAQALKQSVEQRRLLVYSADERVQADLGSALIGGALPRASTREPEIGVYLNDSNNDKLTYYLRYRTNITADRCSLGAQRLRVRTILRSTLPEGTTNPFVVGRGRPGLRLGDMRITAFTYGPVGGRIDSLKVDGRAVPLNAKSHLGRPVGAITLDVPRGASRAIEYTVYSARGQSGEARLLTTPGAKTDGMGTVGPSAC